MLNLFRGSARDPSGAGSSRRAFLRAGFLGLGCLTLADLLRLQAQASVRPDAGHKSVIMVYLPGGPSHIDLYDMKPDAPVEIRGEFKPIRTNVPGMDICELMPLQAGIADKFAVVRGFRTSGGHDSRELTTGFRQNAYRPAFGSVVSRLKTGDGRGLPPYVSLIEETNLPFGQDPAYLGPACAPISLRGQGTADLTLSKGVTFDRVADRTDLMHGFDAVRRDLEVRRELDGADAFTNRALEVLTSPKAREAFDVNREPAALREKYGGIPGSVQFLLARRLVEAGVRVVTLCGGWDNDGEGNSSSNLSNWDTHFDNFPRIRKQAPHLDRALYALVTDLADRGLDKDVVVVACGEMGRSPRVGKPNSGGNASSTGRDHWETGFAWIAGGGLRTGQIVGATDRYGEKPKGQGFTAQNLLATLYQVMGIDTTQTFPDHAGRPQYVLDDREPITELL
jgi:hypothetical protein